MIWSRPDLSSLFRALLDSEATPFSEYEQWARHHHRPSSFPSVRFAALGESEAELPRELLFEFLRFWFGAAGTAQGGEIRSSSVPPRTAGARGAGAPWPALLSLGERMVPHLNGAEYRGAGTSSMAGRLNQMKRDADLALDSLSKPLRIHKPKRFNGNRYFLP